MRIKFTAYNLQLITYSFMALLTVHCVLSTACYARPVTSRELIEKAKRYNNTVVEYQGEAVGDVMVRGDFAWININDGENAVGVWGDKVLLKRIIKYTGSYKYKGDIVWVKGVFHRACFEHGGDLDIHLTEATKIKGGFTMPHPVGKAKILNTIGLFIVASGLCALCAFRAKRK